MIDIILSTRNNNSKDLYTTLDSLNSLSFSFNYKIYIINDSSNPLLENSIPDYITPFVEVTQTSSRLGLAHALNLGISLGKNRYIARLDVGDKTSAERFTAQVSKLDRSSNLAFVGLVSTLLLKDKNDNILSKRMSQGPLSEIETANAYKYSNPIVHGSVMFKRDVFNRVGGYDESYKVAQDINLFLRMMRIGYEGVVIDDLDHSHTFYKDTSSTLIRNRESRLNAMRSRLLYLSFSAKLSPVFIIAFIKDIIFLVLPMKVISTIKKL